MTKQCIIAHRGGGAGKFYENTMEAYENAISIGAQALELDVRRTGDGILVSHHDDHVDGSKLSEMTFEALNLKALLKGYRVPTVEEILYLSRGRIFLDIELKETGYEAALVQLVRSHLDESQYVMKSFIDEAIIAIKSIHPPIRTGLLLGAGCRNLSLQRLSEFFPVRRIRRTKPDFVAPYDKLMIFFVVWQIRWMRLPIYVWTVNHSKRMKRLLKAGVNGIITDYPEIGLKMLAEHRQVL